MRDGVNNWNEAACEHGRRGRNFGFGKELKVWYSICIHGGADIFMLGSDAVHGSIRKQISTQAGVLIGVLNSLCTTHESDVAVRHIFRSVGGWLVGFGNASHVG